MKYRSKILASCNHCAVFRGSSQVWTDLLYRFLAIISVSLGILNLLPIPMLDGGHLLFYIVEMIKGSPVSQRVEELGMRVGLTAIGSLMVWYCITI